MLRTKIIATIGPAGNSDEAIEGMIAAGMDVARINFSHGDHRTHREYIAALRRVSRKLSRPLSIMADLSGPKIRTGAVEAEKIELITGSKLKLTGKSLTGTSRVISIGRGEVLDDLDVNDVILLADGLLQLTVIDREGADVVARVDFGGELRSNQGINIPEKTVSIPTITEKDHFDLEFILDNDFDWIALSFVREKADIEELRAKIAAAGKDTPVIAKIEKHEAVDNIDEIIGVADGIMLARGDLGVEVKTETVPAIQKKAVAKAQRAGKPVIVATQMLESMIKNPRPTRAETSDVANAILDGADAVMLSGETAIGGYPVESVRMMSRIGKEAEAMLDWDGLLAGRNHWAQGISESISYASCQLSQSLGAKAIITPTQSGQTARQVSRYRPRSVIIAVSPLESSVRRLMLSWGVRPILINEPGSIDDMLATAKAAAESKGLLKKGDTVVITAGTLVNVPGTTNLIKVDVI